MVITGRLKRAHNATVIVFPQPPQPHQISDDGLELRSTVNINTAALVTIVQCNTRVAQCSRQLIRPAVGVFVILGPLHCD